MKKAHLIRLLETHEPRHLVIAELDGRLLSIIGAETIFIRLRNDYARKMLAKHGLSYEDIFLIRHAIEHGSVLTDRIGHLTFFYRPSHRSGEWFQASIKAAAEGRELWVSTFHRTRRAEVDRKIRLYGLLRKGRDGSEKETGG